MKRLRISAVVFCLMALTAPWFFTGRVVREVAGVPAWVAYATVLMVVYPVAIAWLLRRFWAAFEEPAQWHPDRDLTGSKRDKDADQV